jgi:hypothetical protein
MEKLVHLGVYVLETMFLIGAIGSAFVLVLAAISESRGAFGHEDDGRD